MIFSLLCLLFNFSRICVEGMTLVFYASVLKVMLFNSSASEQWPA